MVAKFWQAKDRHIQCTLCPHMCKIKQNTHGLCTARKNTNNNLIAESYGKITSIALDPIEKKPLYMFHPNALVLSIGSYGCNFHCPFCQNHTIAMPNSSLTLNILTPEDVLEMAQKTIPQGNIGVAFTYNEPLISYEFIYDCAVLLKQVGLKTILVTNGFISPKPLQELLPLIDAMNIDLKGFTQEFYNHVGGNLSPVKETIKAAAVSCHVEITTLVIPNENEDHVEPIARWIASINPSIPLHLSRFFPRNKYTNRQSTPHDTMFNQAEAAKKHLKHVFLGNM